MKRLPDGIINLVYIDPPFCTQKNRGYKDVWKWDEEIESHYDIIKDCKVIKAFKILLGRNYLFVYLVYIYIRIMEMHRVLAGDGSIYVHCDYRVDSYLRLILDDIFGKENFVNEIIWKYHAGTTPWKGLGRKHDVILFYSKNPDFKFNQWREPIPPEKWKDYRFVDEEGRKYRLGGNRDTTRYYLDEGRAAVDVWVDINIINKAAKERLNFPTQKPQKLLERIVKMSSNEGDLVADFFCGSGTTCAVAKKLNRCYIGFEINLKGYKIAKSRLEAEKTLWDMKSE